MVLDLRQVLVDGHAALSRRRQQGEAKGAGLHRVGNAGIRTEEGVVFGTCHRVSLARLLGLQPPPGMSQRIMFMAGERNEDSWEDVLKAAGLEVDRGVLIKSEFGGRMLMGHPDIIIKRDGVPVLGLELKGIYGSSTLESVLKGTPKNENLIQAATYSTLLGIPFALCYTLPSWTKVGSRLVKPLYKLFYMEWREGVLCYRDEGKQEWRATAITASNIRRYYEYLDEMQRTKDLGPRLTSSYIDGTQHKYGPDAGCTFCSYKSACARYDQTRDYDKWVDDAAHVEGEE